MSNVSQVLHHQPRLCSTTYGPLAYNNPLLAGGAAVASGAWLELVEVVVGQVSEVQAEEEDELDCCQSPQAWLELEADEAEAEAEAVVAGCKMAAATVGVLIAMDALEEAVELCGEHTSRRWVSIRQRYNLPNHTTLLTADEEALAKVEAEAASLTRHTLPPLFLYFLEARLVTSETWLTAAASLA